MPWISERRFQQMSQKDSEVYRFLNTLFFGKDVVLKCEYNGRMVSKKVFIVNVCWFERGFELEVFNPKTRTTELMTLDYFTKCWLGAK